MPRHFLVTNFAYGTGPYLRATELALALNDELEQRGEERLGVIVPLVYGEKQKGIMREEFTRHADEIFLDGELGKILGSVFYGGNTYEEALIRWFKNVKHVSRKANEHLSGGKIGMVGLSDKPRTVDPKGIVLELNRSPRIRYDIAPSYSTTFGYVADILDGVKSVPSNMVAVRRDLVDKGIAAAHWVEARQTMHAVAYPAAFSWRADYQPRYPTEVLTPPMLRPYPPNGEHIEPGIFVTITGIPGLERLYADAKRLGLRIYSNDADAVPGSIRMLPHVVSNKNILFQFARSGWSSVWLSMISGTPLVVPDFDPKDDPEIYFNNAAVEELGIGAVYRGEPLETMLARAPGIKLASANICGEVLSRWGTLDGNRYCAKIFADDFLKKGKSPAPLIRSTTSLWPK